MSGERFDIYQASVNVGELASRSRLSHGALRCSMFERTAAEQRLTELNATAPAGTEFYMEVNQGVR